MQEQLLRRAAQKEADKAMDEEQKRYQWLGVDLLGRTGLFKKYIDMILIMLKDFM